MTVKLCIAVKLRDYREVKDALDSEGIKHLIYPSVIKGYNVVFVILVESKSEAYRLGNYIVKTLLPSLGLWYWTKED